MSSEPTPTKEDEIDYLMCALPEDVTCDGKSHYWAIWCEDTRRSYPVDGSCPHRDHNRQVSAYDRFRHDGLSHHAALAMVHAHGGDL